MNIHHALLPALLLAGCSTGKEHLVFTTYSKVGVDLALANGSPAEAVFGYKRFEGAIVPVSPTSTAGAPDDAKSIFAGMAIDNGWMDGLCIKQVFATGDAAVNAMNSNQFDITLRENCRKDEK